MQDTEAQKPSKPDFYAPTQTDATQTPPLPTQYPGPKYTNEPVTNYPMPSATIQPINNGYTIQGIVMPYDGRQAIFDDDLIGNVVPAQGVNKIIIVNPAEPLPTVCTSPAPQLFYCIFDNKALVSTVSYDSNCWVWFWWILLFVLLFPFSLFFFFCFPIGFQEVVHTCPQCGRVVGRVPSMF